MAGLTINGLTGRKNVIKMLHKMNSTASYSDIILQNKILSNMEVSRKAVVKNLKIQKMV